MVGIHANSCANNKSEKMRIVRIVRRVAVAVAVAVVLIVVVVVVVVLVLVLVLVLLVLANRSLCDPLMVQPCQSCQAQHSNHHDNQVASH